MTGIVILTVIAALLTVVFTLIWWKAGDQWASEEYKRFGHGGRAPKGPPPKVIGDFNAISATEHSDAPSQSRPIEETPKQSDR